MKLSRLIPLIAVVTLSACASQQVGKHQNKPDDRFLSRYLQANRYAKAMKISGTVKIKGKSGWTKSSFSLLLERPDNFRVTFHSTIGPAWFLGVANSENISLIMPSHDVREIIDRKENRIIKIGPLKISPEDFLRLIYPGLEKKWVEKGYIGHSKKDIKVNYGDALYRFRFNPDSRIKVATVERKGGSMLVVRYQYIDNNAVIVRVGDLMEFEMQNVQFVESLPEAAFSTFGR